MVARLPAVPARAPMPVVAPLLGAKPTLNGVLFEQLTVKVPGRVAVVVPAFTAARVMLEAAVVFTAQVELTFSETVKVPVATVAVALVPMALAASRAATSRDCLSSIWMTPLEGGFRFRGVHKQPVCQAPPLRAKPCGVALFGGKAGMGGTGNRQPRTDWHGQQNADCVTF